MEEQSPREVKPLQVARWVLAGLGGLVLLSGAIVNPWVGKLWRDRPMPTLYDVMLQYFLWSAGIGILLLVLSDLVVRFPTRRVHNIALLLTVLSLFVLSDRIVLARMGTPFWTYDAKNHFRYRPNSERAPFKVNNFFHANAYGFLDDDFDREKKPGELRGLVLGNVYFLQSGKSKTTQKQIFSEQLEQHLKEGGKSAQVINTGVIGHGPSQAFKLMKECSDMGADFVVYAFQEFQLYDYYLLDQTYGGPGLDFHRVMQASNPVVGYLANETGFGRWMNEFRYTTKNAEMAPRFKGRDGYFTLKNLHKDDTLNRSWSQLLDQLAVIYDDVHSRGLPMILVLVPFQNQILNSEYRQVFHDMDRHAQAHGVDVVDLATILEGMLFDRGEVERLKARGFTDDAITEMKIDDVSKYVEQLNDLTPAGHKLIADRLYEILKAKGVIKSEGDGTDQRRGMR